MPRRAVLALVAACSSPAPPPARPAPPPPEPPPAAVPSPPWSAHAYDGAVGLAGPRWFTWDPERNGIVERSALDGSVSRTRRIAGLHINGSPRYWEAIPGGGYLAEWHAPTVIREGPDRELHVAWAARGDDWWGAHVVAGKSLVTALSRDSSAVVRLALSDGHEEWRTPLSRWSQGLVLEADERSVYVTHTEYDADAPTPTITVPRRVLAFDLATGRPAWALTFAEHPQQTVTSRGTVVATEGGDLVFFDGPTGRIRARETLGRGNVDPRMIAAGDRLYVAYDRAAHAFDLATGKRRWSAPLALDGGPKLAVLGDLLLVTTAAGSVAALDRMTGARRWDVGVGTRGHRLFASAEAVVVSTTGSAAGFALPPGAPLERATIHGRVVEVACGEAAGASVSVAGAAVPVAADGTFWVTIEARGFVMVGEHFPREGVPPTAVRGATIRLDGRGDYPVPDLTLSECASR